MREGVGCLSPALAGLVALLFLFPPAEAQEGVSVRTVYLIAAGIFLGTLLLFSAGITIAARVQAQEKYINRCQPLWYLDNLNRYRWGVSLIKGKTVAKFFRAAALAELGQDEEALSLLAQIRLRKPKEQKYGLQVQTVKLKCLLRRKQTAEAEACFQEYLRERQKELYHLAPDSPDFLAAFYRWQTESDERAGELFVREVLDALQFGAYAFSLSELVWFHYYKGLYEAAHGEETQARKSFSFAAEHGGSAWYKTAAEWELEALGAGA